MSGDTENEQSVIGFDLREASNSARKWSQDQREIYLLRRDVTDVYSTDTMIWPSVLAKLGLPEVRNDWALRGVWDEDLCDDLGQFIAMRSLESDRPADNRGNFVAVAISVVISSAFDEHEVRLIRPASPPFPDLAWHFLGFDVADRWLLSGLTNCGYTPDEVDALRDRWGTALNEVHLFRDAHDALDFRIVSNGRVPEHAPFFVYGLFDVSTFER